MIYTEQITEISEVKKELLEHFSNLEEKKARKYNIVVYNLPEYEGGGNMKIRYAYNYYRF